MDAPAPVARQVLCQRCGHQWKYKGRNAYVVTCPYCCTKVTLKRSDERLRRQERMAQLFPGSEEIEDEGAAACA